MDINTSNIGWVNVYSSSGIPVGTGLEIQNKNSNLLTVQESATIPAADDFSGRLLRYCEVVEVWPGSVGVWVRGAMNTIQINVQAVPS
ncbi:hypothetical protein AB688_18310 [Pseudomonas putida]|uniref:hypothetical protein n=1 Tax=Pseudomonas putida TaxID=303 RepID=UPI0007B6B499|nr:hypothetical protein [Pseudomonas putida]ANC03962.1 hypothetical protein AB688_18310 [Pseudomonas putida]